MDSERKIDLVRSDLEVLLDEYEKQRVANGLKMMPADMLHGFLTAIVISPRLILPSEWLSKVFFSSDDNLPVFEGKKQVERIFYLLLNIYNGVSKTLDNGTFAPVVSFTTDEKGEIEKKEISFWCKGFVFGCYPSERNRWDLVNDKYLTELCLPIFYNSNFKNNFLSLLYSPEKLEEMEKISAEELIHYIIDAVYKIREYFQKTGDVFSILSSSMLKKEEPKIGRNVPCPCGSGKKYKKCCGKESGKEGKK
ncbi:MAG: YecA family protein [Chitinispirillaceae bacterium]|nr:YecA family protein [Chitinispirillaceae bacterium]